MNKTGRWKDLLMDETVRVELTEKDRAWEWLQSFLSLSGRAAVSRDNGWWCTNMMPQGLLQYRQETSEQSFRKENQKAGRWKCSATESNSGKFYDFPSDVLCKLISLLNRLHTVSLYQGSVSVYITGVLVHQEEEEEVLRPWANAETSGVMPEQELGAEQPLLT